MLSRYPYYLGGDPHFSPDELPVYNKYTGEEVSRVSLASSEVIDAAINATVQAQTMMAALPAWRRQKILYQVVQQLESRHEELSRLLSIEAGKAIQHARGELTRSIDTFRIAAEEAVRQYGEHQPLDISPRAEGYEAIWRRRPIGPVSFISPFNFPLNLVAHKIAPAIAVGCPFLLKPASSTPISALVLAEILTQTDLPKAAFSILPCRREEADAFVEDERLKLLSFTGSPGVGWAMKARAGRKRVLLELGGNAACIVDEGADLEKILPRLLMGIFYQSGQSCISVQRLLIHASLYEPLKERLIQAAEVLKGGDPLDEETFLGPLISESEAQRVERWVEEALEEGAQLLTGGQRQGSFYAPTLLEKVPRGARVLNLEIFGPVACLESFQDFKKACLRVNDSLYGLQAGIFTRDIHKSFYAFECLEVGGVVINDVPSVRVDSMPYGGVKASGLGREGIRFSMEEMTEIRLMLMREIGKL